MGRVRKNKRNHIKQSNLIFEVRKSANKKLISEQAVPFDGQEGPYPGDPEMGQYPTWGPNPPCTSMGSYAPETQWGICEYFYMTPNSIASQQTVKGLCCPPNEMMFPPTETCKLVVGTSCDGKMQFPPPGDITDACFTIDGQEPDPTWIGSTYKIPQLGNTIFQIDGVETIQVNQNTQFFNVESAGQCGGIVMGCTDPVADNFNQEATDDDGSCTYTIFGCVHPDAINYDPEATVGNYTECEFISGCMDPTASNYYPDATADCYGTNWNYALSGGGEPNEGDNWTLYPGSDLSCCIYDIGGCMDPEADNFNPNATFEPGPDVCSYSIDYTSLKFCCDPDAQNYGMDANGVSINGTVTWPIEGPGYGGNYVDTYLMLGGMDGDGMAQCNKDICEGSVTPQKDPDIKGVKDNVKKSRLREEITKMKSLWRYKK
tara:strand:+ start:10170 stop:11462 length:1293 start_codon:yes stop_codon:yes gene_type:complete